VRKTGPGITYRQNDDIRSLHSQTDPNTSLNSLRIGMRCSIGHKLGQEKSFITAVLRPAKRPGGKEIRAFLRRLLRAIRANWPKTEILLRADSPYYCPEVLDWCRGNGIDYILGVAPTSTLRAHIETIEVGTKARFEAAPKDGKVRRFKEFCDGAASWSRVERVIARVEVGAEGPDTRFIVTNLEIRNTRVLYEDVYCRRGQAENHIRSLPAGQLLKTLRPPIGPGHDGKVDAVALSPDGRLVAVGGYDARWSNEQRMSVYLFDAVTGALKARVGNFENVIAHLTFSPDGRFLAATLAGPGLRVIDTATMSEVAADRDYGGDGYGVAFAADGRPSRSPSTVIFGLITLDFAWSKRCKPVAAGNQTVWRWTLPASGWRWAATIAILSRSTNHHCTRQCAISISMGSKAARKACPNFRPPTSSATGPANSRHWTVRHQSNLNSS
jgi:hypothetical protein